MIYNKKGIFQDLIYIILILFVFAISTVIAVTGWNSFNDGIQATDDSIISVFAKDKVASLGTNILLLDKLFALLFVVLWIGLIITSATASTRNPAYFYIYIIALFIVTFISMALSNFYETFITTSELVGAGESLPLMTYFFAYYPLITFFVGLVAGIIFYSLGRTDTGGTSYE